MLTLVLSPAALRTATENSYLLKGRRLETMVKLMLGSMIIGLGVGEGPLSGVMVISMAVMGVKPSAPVIQDRLTLRSPTSNVLKLVTGSAGTGEREGERERERERE